ncbi:hypothetical protein MTYP_01675 [Methylophilaceae bacterium]|nr:hypothetical protein MTYP_01675 [Methylophilaceae bacterium]
MNIKSAFIQFCRDEEGASAIEYALIAAMVAIALVAFIDPINTRVTNIFTQIRDALPAGS